jgi:DNA gyrase subunit A
MYAMDTILDRALPDVRDGLKPVHRRILYAMYHDLRLTHNKPHKKSARVVGEVLGKYHPHGDQSVYDAMVRMAQHFAMRAPLVDGQGNFGSIDGDGAAAMRYTEARLTELAELILQDIQPGYGALAGPNFDGTSRRADSAARGGAQPAAQRRLGHRRRNGDQRAAAQPRRAGRRHQFPLRSAGTSARSVTVDDLLQFIQGPDFPTGGLAFRYRDNGGDDAGRHRARDLRDGPGPADHAGQRRNRGAWRRTPQHRRHRPALQRAKEHGDGAHWHGGTERAHRRCQRRARRERSRGHAAGGRDQPWVTIPNVVLESLLQYTQLRDTFGAQMLALVPTDDGMRPEYLSLRDALVHFIEHRLTVIERRSRFERKKLRDRLHIVEGLLIALAAIDEVVATIKKSRTRESARTNLQRTFKLSDAQAAAIVAMPLGNLASLEVKKLQDERKTLKKRIAELTKLIESETARLGVVKAETADLKNRFATPRRTLILDSEEHTGGTITAADLTEPQIVSLYPDEVERRDCPGYADRGMLGLTGRRTGVPIGRWYAEIGERLLMVASDGDGWHAPVTQVEGGVRGGKRIVGGGIIREESRHVVIITRRGKIKRIRIEELPITMGSWVRVIGLAKGDEVLAAGIDIGDDDEVMLFTHKGYAIRFKTGDANPQQSASAQGVAAIRTGKDDHLLDASVFHPAVAGHVIIASENGWVKRVPMKEWPVQGRAGKGVQSLRTTKAVGNVAAATVVRADDNYVDFATAEGKRLRFRYDILPVDNRPNRGQEIPALLRKQDKKDKTSLAEIGTLQRVSGLSATYMYRGK